MALTEPNIHSLDGSREHNGKRSKSNTPKTIKAPGTKTERIAQACDRCRAKKTKCDGKLPSCSNCAAVGLECIVSDKLSRRAFPKGYTETLEERIRQLEAENKKLHGLVDLKDEQIKNLARDVMKIENDSNLDISNVEDPKDEVKNTNVHHISNLDHNHEEGCLCGCSLDGRAVHERPVSIAGSIYDIRNEDYNIANSIHLSDDESILSDDGLLSVYSRTYPLKNQRSIIHHTNREISPAPGAFAAATAIARMQTAPLSTEEVEAKKKEDMKQHLTSLVALSIPRSTEETLFVPNILSKLCQEFGFDSRTPTLAALSLASSKESVIDLDQNRSPQNKNQEILLKLIMNRKETEKLPESESIYIFKDLLNLPKSRVDMDQLITSYFQDWGNLLPVLNKETFLKNYMNVLDKIESEKNSMDANIDVSGSLEKFGAIMVLVFSLAMLSKKYDYAFNKGMQNMSKPQEEYVSTLAGYDFLIHEFMKPNCIITKHCSIESLQILTLCLLYCLVVGDLTTCYEVRGRVISMAQQLRLHRCPAAVLCLAGTDEGSVHLQNFMQAERRILFWCIYCLDTYSSLNLGVPRMLKDFEIECASPFAGKNDDENDENENILIVNNTKLTIFGKVSQLALSFITYCKVLGQILDSIFSRYESNHDHKKALEHERQLECWRRDLFTKLKFETDINELSFRGIDGNNYEAGLKNFSKPQLILVFLYYHAKMLIYSPIISKYGGEDVGLSMKETLTKGNEDVSRIVSSISLIQSSSIRLLEVSGYLSKNLLSLIPIPLNMPRQQARLSLIVAKGVLDYMKGGPLYQNSKTLLLDTISRINTESSCPIPPELTKSSAKVFSVAVLNILGLNQKSSAVPKKKQTIISTPISKAAVSREPTINREQQAMLKYANLKFSAPDGKIEDNHFKGEPEFIPNETSNCEFYPTNNTSSSSSLTENEDITKSNIDLDEIVFNGDLDQILRLDSFQMDLAHHLQMNEFVADGSLGLVPYLNFNSGENTTNKDSTYTLLSQRDHEEPSTYLDAWG